MKRERSQVERIHSYMAAARPGMTSGRSGLPRSSTKPPAPTPTPVVPFYTFHYGNKDTAVAVAESGSYRLRRSGPLGIWFITLETAGSSTTTVVVKRNGSTVGTENLVSTDDYEELDLSAVNGEIGDKISVAITAAGTGAEGLVVLAPII